jgi:hypothetical protein
VGGGVFLWDQSSCCLFSASCKINPAKCFGLKPAGGGVERILFFGGGVKLRGQTLAIAAVFCLYNHHLTPDIEPSLIMIH